MRWRGDALVQWQWRDNVMAMVRWYDDNEVMLYRAIVIVSSPLHAIDFL